MPTFDRYIGIDYSGAQTPTASLKGLRVFMADQRLCRMRCCRLLARANTGPVVVSPNGWSSGLRKTKGRWLESITASRFRSGISRLTACRSIGLSSLMTSNNIGRPMGTIPMSQFVRDGICGNGAARSGNAHWRRLTELRAGAAKSVFHFDVQGSVAKSTHAGLPWLRYLRQQTAGRVHFWPFDGWGIPPGRSVVAEVYPSLWSRSFPREGRNADQHDAFSVAAWMRRADLDGSLANYLNPGLAPDERAEAQVEGWILGVLA